MERNCSHDIHSKEIKGSVLVDKAISSIENIVNNQERNSNTLMVVMTIINSIKSEDFSVEQGQKIVAVLLDKEVIKMEKLDGRKTVLYTTEMCKKFAVKKLVEAVKIRQEFANDVEELKSLLAMFSYRVEQVAPSMVASLKIKMSSKIDKLRMEKAVFDMENNFSDGIIEIVKNLTSSEIDIDTIRIMINNEIDQLKLKTPKKNYMNGDTEQHVVHIYHKITKALEKKAPEFPITNPESVLNALEQLFRKGFDTNIRAIVHNYIGRGEYGEADALCSYYMSEKDENSIQYKNLVALRNEVKKAEIGQIILRGIHVNATECEQNAFFDVIERRLNERHLNYSTIPLGYNKDGTQKITLADICDEPIISR